ncbi:GntR family transcriptional regulator [Amycolatopsis deserti]|uniref:GntR family transcriptional regulator n=1 Tax=Amycolatopsis deserti TaxID=185696 RepID=A0ABQ3IRL5_9PSEU|nr:GntR family transcriptional regulator [Amycolatopsis deserti]GHE90641.1 GntR family transcriptional regulator [Amycolatopsis deserti]
MVKEPNRNLRQMAVDTLRQAITTGEFPPGSHLGEVQVSEQLGISRGTLREAFRQLQQEGLVEYGERGRVTVRSISEKDIINTFTVRAALEALAGETLASSYYREEHCRRLRAAVDRMARATRVSLEAQIEADLAFHELLVELTGNDALVRSWKLLEGPIRMCIMYRGLERALSNMSPGRHLEIVTAIESGDPVKTQSVISEHMVATAQALLFGTVRTRPRIEITGEN